MCLVSCSNRAKAAVLKLLTSGTSCSTNLLLLIRALDRLGVVLLHFALIVYQALLTTGSWYEDTRMYIHITDNSLAE